jgi:hypothetical protein
LGFDPIPVVVCLLLACTRVIAQDTLHAHVRSDAADIRALIDDAAERSPTVRALIEEIDQSNVIVYVHARMFSSQLLEGRIGLVASTSRTRFLAIELACPRTRDAQMATLAHELHHAVEIARAPWVVDANTLARYYETIGVVTDPARDRLTFETEAARETASRVRRELMASPPAMTNLHERHR